MFEEYKEYIKVLSKKEKSLKSISFSVNEDKKEFTIYFTWRKDDYENYYNERDIFRKSIINYLNNYQFLFNIKKSNPAKYIFINKNG